MTSYRRYKLIAPIALAVISLAWIFNCTVMRQTDYQRYSAFREKQHEINNSSKLVSQNAYQTRQGVRKDIWRSEAGNVRMHYRIESKSSVLKLVPGEGKKAEIIENLQDIKCWMQDKLFAASGETPAQQVRYFEADRGTYLYHSQKFSAHSVSLSLMRQPGHVLMFDSSPKDVFLRGVAQNVSFSVSEGSPQLQAQNFKASIKGSDL